MYLVVAATEMELAPVREKFGAQRKDVRCLVSGVGPVEAALHVARCLATHSGQITGVIHCGVAGAYLETGLGLLDTVLARDEVLAELGICTGSGIEDFVGNSLVVNRVVSLESKLFTRVCGVLAAEKISASTGRMLTVSCVSGTAARGNYLRDRYQAIGECMEGAAVARVCAEFGVDCAEIRTVSNMVEDRDVSRWRLAEACAINGRIINRILDGLIDVPAVERGGR